MIRGAIEPHWALVIGAITFAIGAWFGIANLRFVARTVPTTGVIVSRGGSTYRVRFEVEGRPVTFKAAMPTSRGFSRSRIQPERPIPVRYDPDAPGDARVGGSKLWVFPAAMLFVGLMGIGAGLSRKV